MSLWVGSAVMTTNVQEDFTAQTHCSDCRERDHHTGRAMSQGKMHMASHCPQSPAQGAHHVVFCVGAAEVRASCPHGAVGRVQGAPSGKLAPDAEPPTQSELPSLQAH